MSLLQSTILGLLQGLTEFLPVSSSGHLALLEKFFQLPFSPHDLQYFDIVLHAGSLIALFLAYIPTWKKLLLAPFTGDRSGKRMILLLILATIPAALAGFFLEDIFAEKFRSLPSLAVQLMLSGVVLLLAERFRPRGNLTNIKPLEALMVGIAQVFALVPGLSRSGMTIAASRSIGLSREDSVHFSFLMALPIIGGAVFLAALKIGTGTVQLPPWPVTTAGFVASLIASLAAISLLKILARRLHMGWFAAYLFVLGIVLLGLSFHFERLGDPALVEQSVERYGAIVLFLFAFIETVPPLSFFSPGIIALIIGGALVDDVLTAVIFFTATTLGALLGNTLFFYLGWRYGRKFAHRVHVKDEQLTAADAFLQRFGRSSLFFAQYTGALRPIVAFLSGTVHVPTAHFLPWVLAGTVTYMAFLLSLGYLLRENLTWLLSSVGLIGVGATLIALCAIGFMRRKIKKN